MLTLVDALLDRHWKVRGNAACALPKMGDDTGLAVSRLAGALRDETPYVRGCAAQALGEIGPAALEVAHALEPLLEDENDDVRNRVEQALARLRGSDDPPANSEPLYPPWQSVHFE